MFTFAAKQLCVPGKNRPFRPSLKEVIYRERLPVATSWPRDYYTQCSDSIDITERKDCFVGQVNDMFCLCQT